ncbi:MAG: ABC transporter ATP-binding protein/permease [Clostridiales bacterium]|jgi:ATP-binding cassette subfamily B protein|nr:ABC transporter ATP-binding protein/permease [Clostridiales bacterium]
MSQLKSNLKPYAPQLVLGPFVKLCEAVLELFLPYLMARLVDVGIGNRDTRVVVNLSILILAFSLAGCAFSITCQYIAARTGHAYGHDVRASFLAHVNVLSLRQLEGLGQASLLTRATADVNNVQNAVNMFIRLVSRIPFIVIGSLIMTFTIDPLSAAVLAALIVVFGIVITVIMRATLKRFKATQGCLDEIGRSVKENLTGVRVVRAFCQSGDERGRFEHTNAQWSRAAVRAGKTAALTAPITVLLLNAAVVLVLWLGGWQVDTGRLKQGELIALINYITQVSTALSATVSLTLSFTRAAASVSRLNAVFALTPDITSPAAPHPFAGDAPALNLSDVGFSYDGAAALQGVSLFAARGECVGVVGGTGAGKSTLVRLLSRLYDPTAGEVKIFGVDTRAADLAALRARVGYVPQRAQLFAGSVRENLVLARDVSEEALRRAVETADAGFLYERAGGLDADVARGGSNFSGGQRQRITIARALCGNPDILVLDDALSALDFATESRVRRALKKNYPGMTLVIVSQRISAVENAARILVLDHGKPAGLGTHEALLARCELYRDIFASQQA